MNPTNRGRRGVNILIAEDSPTQAARLEHLLAEQGHTVTTAGDGAQALAAAQRRKPALIISDILMPELDGYGLCKAIKSDDKLKSVPVILVTTLSDPQDVIRGLECGADNFIRKPYDERYLLSRIEYLLMNIELRKNQKMQMGVEIDLGGHKHFITAERQQILDLLISTYEQAIQINEELKLREQDLARSNEVLNGLYRIADGLNSATGEQGRQKWRWSGRWNCPACWRDGFPCARGKAASGWSPRATCRPRSRRQARWRAHACAGAACCPGSSTRPPISWNANAWPKRRAIPRGCAITPAFRFGLAIARWG